MIEKTLENNHGPDSIVKFFQTESGKWYLVGYGGMGTLSVLDVEEQDFPRLQQELASGNLIKVKQMYLLEVGESGIFYYHA